MQGGTGNQYQNFDFIKIAIQNACNKGILTSQAKYGYSDSSLNLSFTNELLASCFKVCMERAGWKLPIQISGANANIQLHDEETRKAINVHQETEEKEVAKQKTTVTLTKFNLKAATAAINQPQMKWLALNLEKALNLASEVSAVANVLRNGEESHGHNFRLRTLARAALSDLHIQTP